MFFSGSGAGWNATLSLAANFSVIFSNWKSGVNRTQPTGFSAHWSWIGGWPCRYINIVFYRFFFKANSV